MSLCLGSPRPADPIARSRMGSGRLVRRADYGVDQLERDLAEHAHVLRDRCNALLGDSGGRRVTCVADGERVVKAYDDRGALASLRLALTLGRARGAWRASLALEGAGVGTPRGLALLERRDGSAVLVMRRARGVPLPAFLATRPQRAAREQVARALGREMGRLAAAGLRHADLTIKHVFVEADGAAEPVVELIDLDNLRRMPAADPRGLARMLGQLGDIPSGIPRADLLAFLRGYRQTAGSRLPSGVLGGGAAAARAREERRRRHALPY